MVFPPGPGRSWHDIHQYQASHHPSSRLTRSSLIEWSPLEALASHLQNRARVRLGELLWAACFFLPGLLKLVQFFNRGPISFTNGGPCGAWAHLFRACALSRPHCPASHPLVGPLSLISSRPCLLLIYTGRRPAGSRLPCHSWLRCLRPQTP